jgi:hypothetical protein
MANNGDMWNAMWVDNFWQDDFWVGTDGAAAVDTSGDAITDGTTFVDSSFVDPYLKPTNTNYPIKT